MCGDSSIQYLGWTRIQRGANLRWVLNSGIKVLDLNQNKCKINPEDSDSIPFKTEDFPDRLGFDALVNQLII